MPQNLINIGTGEWKSGRGGKRESRGRVEEEAAAVAVGGIELGYCECLHPVISFLHKSLWWSEPSA